MTKTQTPIFPDDATMPLPVFLLAAAGAFPLTTLAGMIVTGTKVPGIDIEYALLTYGAIVLSFLGGVHWGLAMLPRAMEGASRFGSGLAWRSYMASMVPGLLAWVALLMPVRYGVWLMVAGFGLLLAYDIVCTRGGHAPSWFLSLRWPLALMAAGSLIAGIGIVRV